MPWQIKMDESVSFIETCYSGLITPAELKEAAMETLMKAREQGKRLFLGDCTALVGGHSVFDLYYLAETVGRNNLAFILKEAVVMPELPAAKENVKFWETKCKNIGLWVRIFENRKSALDWLLEQEGSKTAEDSPKNDG